MKHICPVCGCLKPVAKNTASYHPAGLCDDCWQIEADDWIDAIIRARKHGIIREPVNWAELAEEE